MSIFTVCFTGMMVWVGIPGGPSAVATLALEEKECVRDSEGNLVGGTNQVSPKHPGEGSRRAEWTLTRPSREREKTQTAANKTAGHSTVLWQTSHKGL